MAIEVIVNKLCDVFKVSPSSIKIEPTNDSYEVILYGSGYTVYISSNSVSICGTNAILKANPHLMSKLEVIQSFMS